MNNINTIGLMGRQRRTPIKDTLLILKSFLEKRKHRVVWETGTAALLNEMNLETFPKEQLAKHCDLIIIVGGDGSLLNIARYAAEADTPVTGIHRGRLGFLTDINPDEVELKISEILEGHYQEEKRFLLEAEAKHGNSKLLHEFALNDVVLMPGALAHMIEFSTFIEDEFVSQQHADGLIVATPTGSTAYALSGGGPILHPELNAMVLVTMFPHTLSARPIVVSGDREVMIEIAATNETAPALSCDGQARFSLPLGSKIHIRRAQKLLRLIHPQNYRYFETLRSKLHWSEKL